MDPPPHYLRVHHNNITLAPPQKGAKSALRGHQPIDVRPFRTPSRGIAAFSQNGHFSPTDRSFCTAHRGKRTAEPLIALSMPSRPSRDWRSATLKTIVHHVQLVSWRPSTAFDDGAPKSPFLAPSFWAPSTPNTQKKQKVIGKNFISGLLIMLQRPVYAFDHVRCPSSVHRNYSFLPMY